MALTIINLDRDNQYYLLYFRLDMLYNYHNENSQLNELNNEKTNSFTYVPMCLCAYVPFCLIPSQCRRKWNGA